MNYTANALLGEALTPEQFKPEWIHSLKSAASPKDAMQRILPLIRAVNQNITAHLAEDGKRLDVRVYDITTRKAASANGAYLALFDMWSEDQIAAYGEMYNRFTSALKQMNENYEKFAALNPSKVPIYKPKTPDYALYTQQEQASRAQGVPVDMVSSKRKAPVGLIVAAAAAATALYFTFK